MSEIENIGSIKRLFEFSFIEMIFWTKGLLVNCLQKKGPNRMIRKPCTYLSITSQIVRKNMIISLTYYMKKIKWCRLDGFLSVLEEDAEHEKRRVDPFEAFDPILYVKFRQQPILKSAIEFARAGRIGAVSSLLSKYPAELNRVSLSREPLILDACGYFFLRHCMKINGKNTDFDTKGRKFFDQKTNKRRY